MTQQEDLIHLLLESGADIDFEDSQGNTALFRAAGLGDVACSGTLIHLGANIRHTNVWKETVLSHALRRPDAHDILRYLIGQGADPNVVNVHGRKVLGTTLDAIRISCVGTHPQETPVPHRQPIRSVLNLLLEVTTNINDTNGLNFMRCCLGASIRADVLYYHNCDFPVTVLMLKHGALMPYREMFLVAMQQRAGLPDFARRRKCGFFTVQFTRFLRLAGVNFGNLDELSVNLPRWAAARYCTFLDDIKRIVYEPMTLQQTCCVAVRRSIAVNGPLWSKLDELPVPSLLKKYLKMISDDYDEYICM